MYCKVVHCRTSTVLPYYMNTTDLRLLPALCGVALHALTLAGISGYYFIQLLHEHHRPASQPYWCTTDISHLLPSPKINLW